MTGLAGDPVPALAALDTLIAVELHRLRARYALSLDEFRGLFVSDAMVDALLARQAPPPAPVDLGAQVTRLAMPMRGISARMTLCPHSAAMLTLAMAPELDARYPTLFAYLNDDVTRRWPTLDLAQRLLLAPGDTGGARRLRASLGPAGTLAGSGLVLPAGSEEGGRPLLLQAWRAAPAVSHYVLDLPGQPMAGLHLLDQAPVSATRTLDAPVALLVAGAAGSGRTAIAAAWAGTFGRPALLFTPGLSDNQPLAALARQACLAARLLNAVLVLDARLHTAPSPMAGFDPAVPLAVVVDSLAGWRTALAPRLVLTRQAGVPTAPERAALWRSALADQRIEAPCTGIEHVAGRFQLTAGAIRQASMRMRIEGPARVADQAALLTAARAEGAAELGGLARPVRLTARWDDLILPDGALRQLRDFAAAIALRGQVFGDWGFGAVGRGTGDGLAALFSGGSGTGKTMSAAIIAGELGLDLWRIDLASTVSKYIGETEKNLDRLFSSAGTANAILFFDEADALFGKRGEVKDSHDRYANIEIAYLLQRLEEHPGVVILATNLSRNLDTAFLRRLPFVIDFPMPDATGRARLWRLAIPPDAPLGRSVDLAALAQRHELSGGDIRSAALEAAFLAAAKGGAIDADVLDIAVRRQLMKRGQLPGAPSRAVPVGTRRLNGDAEGRHATA